MAKRKAKTEVTYEVQWRRDEVEWRFVLSCAGRLKALQYARAETQRYGVAHRVVRVERTVVAEVKP